MRWREVLLVVCLIVLPVAACTPSLPATVTPAAPIPAPTGGRVIDIPLGTPSGVAPGTGTPQLPGTPQPVVMGELLPYRDDGGLFSLKIPDGWSASRQPAAKSGSDVRVGVVLQPLVGNGLITVTQFDNGKPPQGLGQTINAVLKLTGWPNQRDYRELGRENVLGRENQAMRVEITYARSNGVPMHSLALFQIDGTTFSMVNVGVDENSWQVDEGKIRDILDTYRVPAEAAPK
jgi:hypothetical protein